MGVIVVTGEMLAAKFGAIFPHLDERQRRLLMGAEARALGHGRVRLGGRAARGREAPGAPGGGGAGSGGGPGFAGAGGAGRGGGSDVAAAVDGEVDPQAGGGTDPPGP